MVKEGKTLITVSKETRERMKAMANKNQTYDQFINELMNNIIKARD